MAFYWNKQSEVDNLLRGRKKKRVRRPRRASLYQRLKDGFFAFLRLCAILVIVGITGFVARSFYFFLLESNYFRINEVIIHGVGSDVQREIEHIIGSKYLLEENIFKVSAASMESMLRGKMPQLGNVEVKKLYPSKIIISARERKPFMYVGTRDIFKVDSEGVVIAQVSCGQQEVPDLPFLTGVAPADVKLGEAIEDDLAVCALEVLMILKRANPGLYEEVSEINVDSQKGLTIVLLNNVHIKLKPRELRKQLAALDTFIRRIGDTGAIAYADFRFNDQIVYSPR